MADVIVLEGLEEVKDLIKETAGRYPPSGSELGNPTNFIVSTKSETMATLTWTNTIDEDFTSVEVYQSYVDMATVDRAWCVANAKRLYKGKEATTTTSSLNIDTRVYYKIFSEYIDLGMYKYSPGVCINMVPNTSNTLTSFTATSISHESATLNWDCGDVDGGFSGFEVFKSTVNLANQSIEWCKQNADLVYNGTGKTTTLTLLRDEVEYHCKIFGKYNTNQYTEPRSLSFTTLPIPQAIIYGFEIDMKNSNPETSVTYIGDAIGMTPGRTTGSTWSDGSWSSTFIYSSNTRVSKTINNDKNSTRWAQFNLLWYKMENLPNEILRFQVTDKKLDDSWKAYAFTREDGTIAPYMQIGHYTSTRVTSSMPGTTGVVWVPQYNTAPTWDSNASADVGTYGVNTTAKEIQKLGQGYNIISYSQYTYFLMLMVLVTKSLDLTKAIGHGKIGTGYGAASSITQRFQGDVTQAGFDVTAFYVTNMWGDLFSAILGVSYDFSTGKCYVASVPPYVTSSAKPSTSNYTEISGFLPNTSNASFIKKMKFVGGCLLPESYGVEGTSSSSYFCDVMNTNRGSTASANCCPRYVGDATCYHTTSHGGPFMTHIKATYGSNESGDWRVVNPRLSYIPPA